MRLVHAAAATAAVLLLASAASAQGLGDAAAREKEKRKAQPAKPAKVYTEGDIGRSMAPVSSTPELPASADAAAADKPAGEAAAGADGAPAATSDAEKEAADARAKAEADWRRRLDQARKEETAYKDVIDKLQLELNDVTSGVYSPQRGALINFQNENKQLLAEVQGRIAALEEEGRRNDYR